MAKRHYISVWVVTLFVIVGVAEADSPSDVDGATTVDVTMAKTLFDRGVPFVDVRGARFFYEGHVPGATNLHWVGEFTESSLGDIVSKDGEIVIYAWHHTEGPWFERASEASKRAVSWGFKKIYYFSVGYPGWAAAGYPTE
jgi:3-mercaptopyruvate sulfurtransferase SseA